MVSDAEVQADFGDLELPSTRGFAGVGIVDPRFEQNVGSIVRSAACYGADFAFTTGAYDGPPTACGHDGHLPVFTDVNVADATPAEAELVAIEMTDESVPLREFQHPERAVYIAGRESTGVPDDVLERADHTVHIQAAWCENVSTAAAIVLHDRLCKAVSRSKDRAQFDLGADIGLPGVFFDDE